LYEKYHALIETYPPKNRILGVNRLRFEESGETTSEKRKRADVSSPSACLPPRTDAREARSRPVSAADVQ
jgi:hypothetical protein